MFLVVGESLVDLIGQAGAWRFDAAPGGSPLNTAVGLAAAGHPVRLASEVGDDLFGAQLRRHLARCHVDTTDLTTGERTNLAIAIVDHTGAASYDFRFAWGWSAAPSLAGVDCLHLGSLAAVTAPGAATVQALAETAHRQGVPISYDPNLRPALDPDRDQTHARVADLVRLATIIKASSEDLAWLHPGEDDLAIAQRWLRQGPALVVVTRGGQGAVALLPDGYAVACDPPAVAVVDTVGAGDAFTAGLLASLAHQGALAEPTPQAVDEALRQATATAAAVCTHRGAAPPGQQQVASLREQLPTPRPAAPPGRPAAPDRPDRPG